MIEVLVTAKRLATEIFLTEVDNKRFKGVIFLIKLVFFNPKIKQMNINVLANIHFPIF